MAKKNVRNMKVCGQRGYKYETVPAITLKGKWFLSFFSYRSFCHNRVSPFDIRQSELMKCFLRVSIS